MRKFYCIKNIFPLILLVILFFTYSCTVSKDKANISNDFPGEVSDSLVASIERTRCFGICPHYKIQIYRSGYVLYEGYEHVENKGRFFTRLTNEQLHAIGMKAEETGYFNLNNEYRNPHLTDFPTVYTEVRFRGKHKKITHYDADPPAALVEMEKYLDSLFPPETNWQVHPDQNFKDQK